MSNLFATKEPSTYVSIFVPPSNELDQGKVCLTVTAIYDNTTFCIIQDGLSNDSDKCLSGTLMAGQSNVLFVEGNKVYTNEGEFSDLHLDKNGIYFIVKSNKLVYASQSTHNDWQFDFLPSISKSSVGQKFMVYSPPTSQNKHDLNVFAYEENTTVTIRKISSKPELIDSKTVIDWENSTTVAQLTINPGEDIIHYYQDGRKIMIPGETYVVESNKEVSLQYGALYGHSGDGGGFTPSSNGSTSGELFYFAVPNHDQKEHDLRIVSWNKSNQVNLSRFENGIWISMKDWTLGDMKSAHWNRKEKKSDRPSVYRVTCSKNKKVSVSIENWLESAKDQISDKAERLLAHSGSTAGTYFLQYMAPPVMQLNVFDPFSDNRFNEEFIHLYLFASDSTNITIKDAKTNGEKYSKTFHINKEGYADCAMSLDEWKSIFNGDGKAESGPERPYVIVTSDKNISLINTSFSDDWMFNLGTSIEQEIMQSNKSYKAIAKPGL